MDKTKNIHAGHRQRLYKHVEETGIYNLSDLHFLEYLLTFIIPRVDTNPIAHKLLKEYKTVDNIFHASRSSLVEIDGIGEKSAKFLQFMSSVCYMYNKATATKRAKIYNLKTTIEFVKNVLPPSENEQFIVIIIGKNFQVKNYKIFSGVSHSSVKFDTKVFTEYAIKNRASYCILAHTHPEFSARPSHSDVVTFKLISDVLKSFSISLVENLILGHEDFFSFSSNIIRDYVELDTDCCLDKTFTLNET